MLLGILSVGLFLLPPAHVMAGTISVNVADLSTALASSRSEPDAVRRLLLREIQRKLDELDLRLEQGELLVQDQIVNETIEDGCTQTTIRTLESEVRLAGDTGIEIGLESLFEPITVSLRVSASVNARGRAQQVFGFRLGRCRELASDSFDFSAVGPLAVQLDLSIALNPEWIGQTDGGQFDAGQAGGGTLRVTPSIEVTGELIESGISVDVDDSILRGVIESFLQDEVDDLFSADRLQQELADLQMSLNERLQSDSSDGAIDIELPPSDDEQILALYELLTPQARFPLTAEFLTANRLEIIAALIFEDEERIGELLEDAAFCELTNRLQVELPVTPAYEWRNGSCVVADSNQSGDRFSDATCSEAFDYFATDFADFCAASLDAKRLGNAQSNSFELNRWTLSPGTRFEVGALPIAGKRQPYVQRLNYKNVQTDIGNCALEIRVYKDQPNATNLKPLIALHGGSWQNRGTGFLGVENMATHFVDQGFVVFAPFYRLVGDSDGSDECNNASFNQLLEDTEDAFRWVQRNAQSFGAIGKPVVFGQSAGGHLAAYLSVQFPTDIERAMLFYAPTDFNDFAGQIKRGDYANDTGIAIMQRVTGFAAAELDLQSPVVVDNTFPAIVALTPQDYPPMFLLHGESDSLLPSRQSVRLCNGLAGDIEAGPAPYDTAVSGVVRSFACDNRGSQLHLIAEGEHTLDLCISDELCMAGSPASAAATAGAIEAMLQWSVESLSLLAAPQGKGSGGGTIDWLILLLVPTVFSRRLRSSHRY